MYSSNVWRKVVVFVVFQKVKSFVIVKVKKIHFQNTPNTTINMYNN